MVLALGLWWGPQLHAAKWGPFSYERNGNTIEITGFDGHERSVTIPETVEGLPVTSLSPHAFWGWPGASVTNLSLGATLISLGDPPLDGMDSLQNITVAPGNPMFSSRDGVLFDKAQIRLIRCPVAWPGDYRVPDTVKRIEARAFHYCQNLTRVVVPSGVTEVGADAFAYSSSLISLSVGEGLLPALRAVCHDSGRIGLETHLRYLIINDHVMITGHDYWDMSGFGMGRPAPIKLEIPGQYDGRPVAAVGEGACSSMALSKVTIPASVSSIGEGAFSYCRSLNLIVVDEGNVFYRTVDGVLFDRGLETLLQYPAGRVGDYTIPATVRRVGADGFAACAGLTLVEIPDSVVEIGERAFASCSSLGLMIFGRGVVQIGEGALDTRSFYCVSWGGPPCWDGNCGCHYYGAGLALYFLGDAPAGGGFFGERGLPTTAGEAGHWQYYDLSPPPMVHYLPGKRGWGSALDGVKATPWGGEPVLLNQPQPYLGYAGNDFELSVRAIGPEPTLFYQWQHDAADVPGATNAILTLNPLQSHDAGAYRVIVSNSRGAVTSQVAVVAMRVPAPGSYEAAALALRPRAYWPLDETNGTMVAEFVGGATGTLFDLSGEALVIRPGATANSGTSVDFRGTASVRVESSPTLNVSSGDFSVAAWVNPASFAQSGLVTKGGYDWAQGWLFDFNAVGAGTLRLETSLGVTGGQGTVQTPPGVVTLNEWQHVVVSCRRDPAATAGLNTSGHGWTKIYRNGVLVASGDIGAGDLDNPELPLTIGGIANVDGAAYFVGAIDEVALFGKALSGEQIAALYAAGVGVLPPLQVTRSSAGLTLTWSAGVLQSATTLGRGTTPVVWTDLPDATSPHTGSTADAARFYRVRLP